jgi:hypothetical protein
MQIHAPLPSHHFTRYSIITSSHPFTRYSINPIHARLPAPSSKFGMRPILAKSFKKQISIRLIMRSVAVHEWIKNSIPCVSRLCCQSTMPIRYKRRMLGVQTKKLLDLCFPFSQPQICRFNKIVSSFPIRRMTLWRGWHASISFLGKQSKTVLKELRFRPVL